MREEAVEDQAWWQKSLLVSLRIIIVPAAQSRVYFRGGGIRGGAGLTLAADAPGGTDAEASGVAEATAASALGAAAGDAEGGLSGGAGTGGALSVAV